MRKAHSMESIVIGIGIGLFATILIPVLKKQLKPASAAVATGALAMSESARKWIEVAKEEVEDVVAEAQFERMKRKIGQELENIEDNQQYPLM